MGVIQVKGLALAAALAAGAVGAAVAPASAQIFAGVYVRLGPPAPRYERVPPPRRGYVWHPGAYRYHGGRYVWQAGYYVRAPYPGARWVPGHWVHRYRGWVWISGHWAR